MASSTVKKVEVAAPRIHPEVIAAVKKKPKTKKSKVILKAPVKRVRVKSKRVKLVSVRAANNVIDQTRIAFSVSAIGSLVGIVIGSAVPLITYTIAHHEWKDWLTIYSVLIVGGLLFSANSVFFWTKAAFRSSIKALGFILLVEGAMVFSGIHWVNLLGLSILIGINAVSTGANLVMKPEKKPSWES